MPNKINQSSQSFLIKKIDLCNKNNECTVLTLPEPIKVSSTRANTEKRSAQQRFKDHNLQAIIPPAKRPTTYEELRRKLQLRKMESRDIRLKNFLEDKKRLLERKKLENEQRRLLVQMNRERNEREEALKLLEEERRRRYERYARAQEAGSLKNHRKYNQSNKENRCPGCRATGKRGQHSGSIQSKSTISLYGTNKTKDPALEAKYADPYKLRIYLPHNRVAKSRHHFQRKQPANLAKNQQCKNSWRPGYKRSTIPKDDIKVLFPVPSSEFETYSYNGPTAVSMLKQAEERLAKKPSKRTVSYKISNSGLYAPKRLQVRHKKPKKGIHPGSLCRHVLSGTDSKLGGISSIEILADSLGPGSYYSKVSIHQQSTIEFEQFSVNGATIEAISTAVQTSFQTIETLPKSRADAGNQLAELNVSRSSISCPESSITVISAGKSVARESLKATIAASEDENNGIQVNTDANSIIITAIDRGSAVIMHSNTNRSGTEELSETFLCEEASLTDIRADTSGLNDSQDRTVDEVGMDALNNVREEVIDVTLNTSPIRDNIPVPPIGEDSTQPIYYTYDPRSNSYLPWSAFNPTSNNLFGNQTCFGDQSVYIDPMSGIPVAIVDIVEETSEQLFGSNQYLQSIGVPVYGGEEDYIMISDFSDTMHFGNKKMNDDFTNGNLPYQYFQPSAFQYPFNQSELAGFCNTQFPPWLTTNVNNVRESVTTSTAIIEEIEEETVLDLGKMNSTVEDITGEKLFSISENSEDHNLDKRSIVDLSLFQGCDGAENAVTTPTSNGDNTNRKDQPSCSNNIGENCKQFQKVAFVRSNSPSARSSRERWSPITAHPRLRRRGYRKSSLGTRKGNSRKSKRNKETKKLVPSDEEASSRHSEKSIGARGKGESSENADEERNRSKNRRPASKDETGKSERRILERVDPHSYKESSFEEEDKAKIEKRKTTLEARKKTPCYSFSISIPGENKLRTTICCAGTFGCGSGSTIDEDDSQNETAKRVRPNILETVKSDVYTNEVESEVQSGGKRSVGTDVPKFPTPLPSVDSVRTLLNTNCGLTFQLISKKKSLHQVSNKKKCAFNDSGCLKRRFHYRAFRRAYKSKMVDDPRALFKTRKEYEKNVGEKSLELSENFSEELLSTSSEMSTKPSNQSKLNTFGNRKRTSKSSSGYRRTPGKKSVTIGSRGPQQMSSSGMKMTIPSSPSNLSQVTASLARIKRQYAHLMTSSSSSGPNGSGLDILTPDSTSIIQNHAQHDSTINRQKAISNCLKSKDRRSQSCGSPKHTSQRTDEKASKSFDEKRKYRMPSRSEAAQVESEITEKSHRLYGGECLSISKLVATLDSRRNRRILAELSSEPNRSHETRLRAGAEAMVSPIYHNGHIHRLVRSLAVLNYFRNVVGRIVSEIDFDERSDRDTSIYMANEVQNFFKGLVKSTASDLWCKLDELKVFQEGSSLYLGDEYDIRIREFIQKIRGYKSYNKILKYPLHIPEDIQKQLNPLLEKFRNFFKLKIDALSNGKAIQQLVLTTKFSEINEKSCMPQWMIALLRNSSNFDKNDCSDYPIEVLNLSNGLAKLLVDEFDRN